MTELTKYKLLFKEYEALIVLYERIENMREIHSYLGNEFNCCLINAHMIWEINQILVAINKAINTKLNSKLITKSLNNEILFNLYPGKNISEGLKTFGVNENSDSLPIIVLIVKQINDCNINTNNIIEKIKGKLLPIESLKVIRNESLIDKTYNLKNCQNVEKAKWDLILSRIASKDII